MPLEADAYLAFTFGALAALAAAAIAVLLARQKRLRREYDHEREQLKMALDDAQREIARHQRDVETFERIARIGTWSSNYAAKTIQASKMCLAIYEVPSAGLPFSPEAYVAKFIDDEAERKTAAENVSKLQRGEPIEGVRKIRVAEGKYKYVYIRSEPRLNENGAVEGSDGVIRDVTEEHLRAVELIENRAALKAREDDLHRAQRLAKLGSWRMELATGYMNYSPEYLNLFGLTPETAPRTADAWVEYFVKDPADAARVRTRFQHALETGESYSGIREFELANGIRRWFSYAADPIRGPDGKVVSVVGATRDVTEEYTAQISLAISEERYRMISENMQDIVTLHEPSGKLIYGSPSLKRQLGYTLEAAANRLPYEYVHPDDLTDVKLAIAKFICDALPSTKIEYRLRKHDGEYAWLETYFTRVVDDDQTLSHFQGLTRDIDERKTAELALANRTGELSATNALLVLEGARRQELERRVLLSIENALNQVGLELHDDLGQQLTGISLLAKTLENKLTSSPPHGERSAARDAARISELVNRAINHTRMISHGLSPYIGGEFGLAIALAQLANDIDSLGIVACVARVDKQVQVADEVAARSLFRIAQEATNNSLKHSGATLIQISLKVTGHNLQLTVGDDGSINSPDQNESRGGGSNALHSIRHRCRSIGARVTYRHFARVGTFVCVRWPLSASTRQEENRYTVGHNSVNAVLLSHTNVV